MRNKNNPSGNIISALLRVNPNLKKLKASLFTLILFFWVLSANATNYYVAPWGDDNNSGSEGAPWKTINKAANTLLAGDVVYIRGGYYKLSQPIRPKNAGTADAWITYAAYPGEVPVIDAESKGASGNDHPFHIDQKDYIRVIGLHIKRSYSQGFGVSQSDYVEFYFNRVDSTHQSGIGIWGNGGAQDPCEHIKVIGNKIFYPNIMAMLEPGKEPPRWPPHEGITFGRVEDYECAYNELAYGEKEGIDSKGPCKRAKIHNNYLHDIERVAIYVDAWTSNSDDFEIYENYIARCQNGIAINSEDNQEVHNVKIHHNIMYDMETFGMTAGYSNDKVQNIEIYNNVVYGGDHGFYITNTVYDLVMRNNFFYNINWKVYQTTDSYDGTAQNATVEYNILDDTDGDIDPKFVDAAGGNFYLQSGSPAIDAGHPDAKYNDPDGSRNDIGAYYYAMNVSAPASPDNFTVTAVGQNQFDIQWNDNSNNEDAFVLERKRGNGPFEQVLELGRNVTGFSDYGFLPNTTCTYRVKAINNAGESAYTPEVNATTADDGYNATTYILTVNGGTTSGEFEAGAVVTVTANVPAAGKYFLIWSGDTTNLADPSSATTTLTMPAADVSLTAVYEESPFFTLTVENGTGSGDYQYRESIEIEANPAPEGKLFDVWTGDTEFLSNAGSPKTTVKMPFKPVSISASYKEGTVNYDDAFATENFDGGSVGAFYPCPSGNLSKENWNEGFAAGAVRGYLLKETNPLTYLNLTTSPKYVNGGHAWKSIETYLDVIGVFNNPPDYSNSDTLIGYNEISPTTLYMSVLLRDEGARRQNLWVGLSNEFFEWMPANSIVYDDNSNWALRLNGDIHSTGVSKIENEAVLLVLKMEFIDATTTDFSLFVNPTQLGGEEPATADLKVTDNNSFTFKVLNIMLGAAENQASADEVRFGASYKAVTPTSGDVPAEKYTLTVENGSGSGDYEEGTVVNITADAPAAGTVFDGWTGDISGLASTQSSSTSITMPATDVTVTANFTTVVGLPEESRISAKVYPNPVSDASFIIELTKPAMAVVTDLAGKELFSTQLFADKNRISTGKLEKGIYIIRIHDEHTKEFVKLIVD